MKNAANFKRKYLKTSERVDALEDYQMNVTNEEKRREKREEEMKRELTTLHTKLEQIESEKSCSYKREDKTARQLHTLKQDVKNFNKENNRLLSQLKVLQQEKDKLQKEITEVYQSKEDDIEKNKDLEARIYQLLYEKDSILEMLGTLERAIPSPEIQRLFSEFILNQKTVFELEDEKNKLENELLAKEKEVRATAKEEQLSSEVINMRKEIEIMRKNLANLDSQIEDTKGKLSSLKDELHCVEIHEKRRNDVIFQTERTLLEQREENEILKREIGYLSNSKNDIERAYKALIEEKKMIDRELMTLRSQMGSVNNSVLTQKQGTFTSTLNPGDYMKNKILPGYNYSTHMNPGETSSFISPGVGHKYHSFYNQNASLEEENEGQSREYDENSDPNEGEDQILEQSYESESHYSHKQGEISIQDKLKQVKEAFNSIKSSIHN